MGVITAMHDRRDINRRADLRRNLQTINNILESFQKTLNQLREKDSNAYKRCLEDLENIRPLLVKLYKDLEDVHQKRR
jgi:prefoldin subunit 5